MTSWGQEAELKGRIEQRREIGPVMSADRHAGRPSGGGGSRLEVLWGFFFFIFHSHLDNQGKNGGVLWTLREPFSFRDLSPCGNRECLPSFTVTF